MIGRSPKYHSAMDVYEAGEQQRGLRLMEECAEDGDPAACFMAALWYRDGEGATADLEMSAKWLARFVKIAEQGDVEAQWDVGQSYRFGDMLPLDIKRANEWLERAAEGGSGDAQHHLAIFYENGLYNYPMDPAEAAKWYQRAFDRGHPETLYLYATKLFRDGKPTEEAISLLRKAASRGFAQARHVLDRYLQ